MLGFALLLVLSWLFAAMAVSLITRLPRASNVASPLLVLLLLAFALTVVFSGSMELSVASLFVLLTWVGFMALALVAISVAG